MNSVTAAEALKFCRAFLPLPDPQTFDPELPLKTPALLDVRSEGEAAEGAIAGFVNLPILTNSERHEVGITYKVRGQDAAIRLGHRLVGSEVRAARTVAWRAAILRSGTGTGVVACWRGGLRSGTAAEWIREAGAECATVVGGYKGMRRELLAAAETPPPLVVISGLTGSGKTRLLQQIPGVPRIDLEQLAAHRGSSFGRRPERPQPAQATFESALALHFWGRPLGDTPILVEDESLRIGRCAIPRAVKARMETAPLIWVEASVEERARSIVVEYVDEPLRGGEPPLALEARLEASILALRTKLGGELQARVSKSLREAMAQGRGHEAWVEPLLTEYYDRMYRHSQAKTERKTLYSGDLESCKKWILDRFASPKR
ncbi:MAG: tRNA 2-selenouridine(34) synthase MnmH [Bdellovibrionales bacterium]|nr:tRNA 2-selenouridine(34) synthase MnmH [Bdellovibrionales bacterium]